MIEHIVRLLLLLMLLLLHATRTHGTWTLVVMAALRSRCGHYIFVLYSLFYLSSFFRRLISAVADWMSTVLPNMVWP